MREKRDTFFAPPSLFDLATAEAAAEQAAEVTGRTPLQAFWASFVCAIPRAFLGAVIPSPVKIADQMWSMFVLQNLTSVNWVRLPCSTYSVGLRLISHVGFWDTGVESVPEDYHTALKLYWGTAGRARLEPIYHPVLYQHIQGESYFDTISQRFQQGVRHMWGATDLAYILWLMIRMPVVPFFSRIRIFATVTDVHISSAASAFLSTFAMPLLALLRPGYFGTPLGHILLVSHEYAICFLIFITLVTGAIYEWYAAGMVEACKPRPRTAADEDAGLKPLPLGTLTRHVRSTPCSEFSGGMTFSRAATYLLQLLPWIWAPITAVMYLLGPSSVAQTRLICNNRMRKAHVSPKAMPTPVSTPRSSVTPINGIVPGTPLASPAGAEVIIGFSNTPAPAAAPARPSPIRLNLPAAAFGGSAVTRRGDNTSSRE